MIRSRLTRRELLVKATRCAGAAAAGWAGGQQSLVAGGAETLRGLMSLRGAAASRGRFYGAAVDVGLLRADAGYRALLVEQCGMVVAENAMKWAAVHPERDRYSFADADALVAFAEQHGIKVRGHNLVWHEALPAWFAEAVTAENAAEVLTAHIRSVAGRYKGRIRAWDVVNEAIWVPDGRADGLRDSPWLRLLGPGYVELAFRTAREADPHALLTYNEYGIEYDKPESVAKRRAVLGLLRELKARGVPVDAVGIQSHLDATVAGLGGGIVQFAKEARGLGLKVFVTELDVNDDNVASDGSAARDGAVAQVYGEYVSAMVLEGGVTDVLTWGVSDNHSWLNGSKWHEEKHPGRVVRGLPFDARYQAKLAFYELRGALRAKG